MLNVEWYLLIISLIRNIVKHENSIDFTRFMLEQSKNIDKKSVQKLPGQAQNENTTFHEACGDTL